MIEGIQIFYPLPQLNCLLSKLETTSKCSFSYIASYISKPHALHTLVAFHQQLMIRFFLIGEVLPKVWQFLSSFCKLNDLCSDFTMTYL